MATTTTTTRPLDLHAPPTLRDLLLIRLAIKLWNQPVTRRDIEWSYAWVFPHPWHCRETLNRIGDQLAGGVSSFHLPATLALDLRYACVTIGSSICHFIDHYNDAVFLTRPGRRGCHGAQHFYDRIRFTASGRVDHARTATRFLHDVAVPVDSRFRLACLNACHRYLPALWSRLSEEQRERLASDEMFRQCRLTGFFVQLLLVGEGGGGSSSSADRLDELIVRYDSDRICRSGRRVSRYVYAVKWSALHRRPEAVDYFWSQLRECERAEVLEWTARGLTRRRFGSEVLMRLLARMSGDAQLRLLNLHPGFVLVRLAGQWHWRDSLLDAVGAVRERLDGVTYLKVLRSFGAVQGRSADDAIHRTIFRRLWLTSSAELKRFVLSADEGLRMMADFLELGDCTNFRLILDSASDVERDYVLRSQHVRRELDGLAARRRSPRHARHKLVEGAGVACRALGRFFDLLCDVLGCEAFALRDNVL